jgi:hypothetical protein
VFGSTWSSGVNVFWRNCCVALLCAVALSASIAAQTREALAQNKSDAVAMPANHRALIARYMLTQLPLDKKTLNTAMISAPFGKWGGLFSGGTIPTVCVSVISTNMLGMTGKGYFLFTVRNGRAERLSSGNALIDTCPPFTPFHEVRQR